MTTQTKKYRPKIGETLFIGFMMEKPFVATVTDYYRDDLCISEQFEFIDSRNGKKNRTSLDLYTFFPDALLDSKFIYCVVQESMEDRYSWEEAYFFDPQSAFDYMEALESGAIKPRIDAYADDRAFRVEVEKV